MPSLTTKPLYVVIDTSIFENENFNFNSHNLTILKQYMQDGTISGLFVPDVVVGESQKHFRDRIKKANERIESLLNGRELKPFSATKSLSKYVKTISNDQLFKEMVAVMNKYLRDTRACIIKTDKIKIKDVLNDYYNSLPPFGTGKKAHEFRDDIIIRRLRDIANTYNEIVSISADGDWGKALEHDKRFITYTRLEDLFSSITMEKELTQKSKDYFRLHRNEIDSKIEDVISGIPCFVDGLEYDRKGVIGGVDYLSYDIQEVSVRSLINGIDYISDEEVITRLFVQADFEIDCTYRDESDSCWDSENDDYIHEEIVPITEGHLMNLIVIITFSVKDGDVIDVKKVEPIIKNKTLRFDEESRRWRRGKNFDGFFSYKKNFECPQCGHNMCLDLINDAESYISYDDREMGAEIEHIVDRQGLCPRCGNGYEITGIIYEYPAGAFNNDTTKIKWEK